LKIGLTGGIGSGKSTVANRFAALGVPVIDADQITRILCQPGQSALNEIVANFGAKILDDNGYLKREVLREIIFHNDHARHKLENILHPKVRAEMELQINQLMVPTHYIILVIPLLLETGQNNFVDRILVVDCSNEVRINRAINRDHVNREQIDAIFFVQVSRTKRLAAADDVIFNDGDLDDLYHQIDVLHKHYLEWKIN